MRSDFLSKDNPLILGSASPRRKMLLEQIGLPFLCRPSEVEEDYLSGDPCLIVRTLAEKKATAVSEKTGKGWVLGADTVVVFKDAILGKPSNPDKARKMLSLLSGNEHKVITGFCILDSLGNKARSHHVITSVKMKKIHQEEMNAYIATNEPFGKAGSYAIQGIGAFMVEDIKGSYSNVVGLPLCALVKSLIEARALKHFPL